MRWFAGMIGIIGLCGLAACGDDGKPTGGVDLEPPTIAFLAPADSASMPAPRSIEFRARATDDIGVRVVVFYFDGAQVGDDAVGVQDIFSYLWPTEPLSAGPHRAIARAFDWAGLSAADTVTVIITE